LGSATAGARRRAYFSNHIVLKSWNPRIVVVQPWILRGSMHGSK
jgi:hypothetical protein